MPGRLHLRRRSSTKTTCPANGPSSPPRTSGSSNSSDRPAAAPRPACCSMTPTTSPATSPAADGVVARPNGLALSDHVRAEQVKLDFPGDVGDAGPAGLAGGEVAGFLGLARAGPVRAVPDEGGGGED